MRKLWKALDGPTDFIVLVAKMLIMESSMDAVTSVSNAVLAVIRPR